MYLTKKTCEQASSYASGVLSALNIWMGDESSIDGNDRAVHA